MTTVLVLIVLTAVLLVALVAEDVARREWRSDALHVRRLAGRPRTSLPHETVVDPLRGARR